MREYTMMIRYECLRIIRNPKWKYTYLILLGSFLYYVTMSNDSSMDMKLMLRMGTIETMQSACLLPVVLLCYLLYHIAQEEEPSQAWKTLLPYPVPQGKRITAKLCILLLFQIPILCVPMILYYIMTGTFQTSMLSFAYCMQLIYLASFMYYTFDVSSGYLSQMGSVKIVNVLKTCTPIFLLFCTTNIKDWMFGFGFLWNLLTLCFIILMAVLLFFHRTFMQRKLYREMILYKLFGFASSRQSEMMSETLHDTGDKILQTLFHMFPKKSAPYWKVCAFVEVGIKVNGFYLLIGAICFILWKRTAWILFFMLTIVSLAYVVYSCGRERNRIRRVKIDGLHKR